MNNTNVLSGGSRSPDHVLNTLAALLGELTPQVQKVATYVLENPSDISVSSVREIAAKANVKPNTVMRMARSAGFSGFEDFREPFREQIRNGAENFQDRAGWLQSLASGETRRAVSGYGQGFGGKHIKTFFRHQYRKTA